MTDLHDGLGPLLASQTMTIAATERAMASDPNLATALLSDAIDHTRSPLEDVRRIVRGLRPPTLDDLGLRGALEALARFYTQADITISLELPEELPPLPAATEVACYRIAQEAVTNAVRHSGGRECRVKVAVGDTLDLVISDDGTGCPVPALLGVGVQLMRSRAEELGGSFSIANGSDGGTRVAVSLPGGAPG